MQDSNQKILTLQEESKDSDIGIITMGLDFIVNNKEVLSSATIGAGMVLAAGGATVYSLAGGALVGAIISPIVTDAIKFSGDIWHFITSHSILLSTVVGTVAGTAMGWTCSNSNYGRLSGRQFPVNVVSAVILVTGVIIEPIYDKYDGNIIMSITGGITGGVVGIITSTAINTVYTGAMKLIGYDSLVQQEDSSEIV